jgi:hypothetical protein
MICHLQCVGPTSGGFGFGAACFREMSSSIPDCICTDTAVASFATTLSFSSPTTFNILSTSTDCQSPTFLVTETAPPDDMRIGANSDYWVLWCLWGNDPPAPQVCFHTALAKTVGLPYTVTSQTTRRNDTTWRSTVPHASSRA